MRRSQSSSPPLQVSVVAEHWQKLPAPPSGRQSQPATQLSAEAQGAAQRRSSPPELRQAPLAQSPFWVQGLPGCPGSVEVSAVVSVPVSAEPPEESLSEVSPVAVSAVEEPVSFASERPPRSTPVVEQAVKRSAARRSGRRQDMGAPWAGVGREGSRDPNRNPRRRCCVNGSALQASRVSLEEAASRF